MSKQNVGLTALSVSLLALTLMHLQTLPPLKPVRAPRRLPCFTLSKDLPAFGLLKNNIYTVDPDALIYLGDPVAVRLTGDTIRIESYNDDLMGCVVGLVLT